VASPGATRRGAYYRDDGPGTGPAPDLSGIAEPVPRPEALHPRANRPYVVFERTYVPMTALAPYRERGTATWYGRRYHGQRTSIGEVYDMYAMTAAHPTLPIPSYARVTHLASGRSVTVRVNDRGPFLHGRLIDLSYAAAARLGYVNAGSAEVEVELVTRFEAADSDAPPGRPLAAEVAPSVAASRTSAATAPPSPGVHYLQLAAFASRESAEASRERLAREVGWLADRLEVRQEGPMYKVHAGPFGAREEALSEAQRIREATGQRPFAVTR
jgi:rare lipoprotein A